MKKFSQFLNVFKNHYPLFLKIVLFLFPFFFTTPLHAQWDTITQKIRLPHSINSYSNITTPVISENGKHLLFNRKYHPDNVGGVNDPDDIWYSYFENETWRTAYNWYDRNSTGSDIVFPESTENGLFYSSQPLENGFSPFKEFEELEGDQFRTMGSVIIENFYNRSEYISAFQSLDKKIILLAVERDDTRGNLDLYVSINRREPINLGSVINTSGIETAPLLARDGKTLYFASSGHGGYGKLDLFKSTRLDDTWQNWTPPMNLGPVINTREDENSMCLTQTGDTAYVVSWDSVSERSGIYMVRLEPQLRPQKIDQTIENQSPAFKKFPDVLFLKNSAHISDDERIALYETFKRIDRNTKLVVCGFTDDTGTPQYNRELARRRAENVRQELLIMGFKNANIKAEARGATDFKNDNSTEDLRAQNRRVEIEIVK
jgi:outer membrane protein OmpA-like peptidoglycan-associated protein